MQRWWDDAASSRAALALVDDSDPQRGMGVAVLGFHGIAKAALTPLATSTLVDPATMADALSDADFTDVELAIAHALSDDLGDVAAVRYAESVVTDMRARTIDAQTRLSRTLVSKGMPWPRAITRAAEVAGVPITSLGRYASQIAAPGLDALAVTDYADRALMEHASARSALEPASSTVSKARVRYRQEQREPFDETEVNRDELGRFAEETRASEAEQVELEARRERRRRRKRSKERRATKLVPTGRTATQTKAERTAVPVRSNRPTHSNRPIRPQDRPKAGEPVGAFGLPVIHPNQIGAAEGPVTFSVPMYVFQDPYDTEAEAAGFMGRAYTEEDQDIVLAELAAMMDVSHVPPGKIPRLVRHRFAPGTLVVQELAGPNDAMDYEESSGVVAYLTYLPGVNDIVDVVFRPSESTAEPTSVFSDMPPRDARTMLSFARAKDSTEVFRAAPTSTTDVTPGPKLKKNPPAGLVPVQVINVDSEMVDREGQWEEVSHSFSKSALERYRVSKSALERYRVSKSALERYRVSKAARVRYRQTQREPWNEADVNRDELGRFAEEEKATEAESAALADRKARRNKRKRSQLRRAKVAQSRREQAEVMRVQKPVAERIAAPGQRAERRQGQRVERQQAQRTEMAPEAKVAQAPLTIKVRGHQAAQARAWLRQNTGSGDLVHIGSREPLLQPDLALVRELTFPSERASLTAQVNALYDRRKKIVDAFGADQTDMLLSQSYELSSYPEIRVLHALNQFSKDLSVARPRPGVADAVKEIMRRGGLAFHSFLNDPRQRADARVLPTEGSWSNAVYDQNILGTRNYIVTRILGPNGPRNEVYDGTAAFDAPTAVIIMTKKAAHVLERLEHLTDPENDNRHGVPFQKVMTTLRQNEVVIEKMPVDMLEDLADEALSRPDTSEVRLDAVDVFRVYVNDERDK